LSSEFIREHYGKLLSIEQLSEIDNGDAAKKLFELVSSDQIPTGREVVIGTLRGPDSDRRKLEEMSKLEVATSDICILDFYRFDENCQERLTFKDGICYLQNGLEISLLGRTATFVGLERLIERHRDRLKANNSRIVFFQSNITEDLEAGACAKARREILQQSIQTAFLAFAMLPLRKTNLIKRCRFY